MSYVKIQNLSFHYPKSKTQEKVIDNFSLDMTQGELLALVGHSGCGKSTILRLLTGLETPTGGTITLDQRVLFDIHTNIATERRDIGMIFQDYALFPHLSVVGNIRFAMRSGTKKEKTEKAMELLELVKMTDQADKKPHHCSGGQQQRIAIARALATKPKLLLLDEPFSNLDAMLRASIREEVRNILQKAGVSAILVTHDLDDVKTSADRCVVLNHERFSQL